MPSGSQEKSEVKKMHVVQINSKSNVECFPDFPAKLKIPSIENSLPGHKIRKKLSWDMTLPMMTKAGLIILIRSASELRVSIHKSNFQTSRMAHAVAHALHGPRPQDLRDLRHLHAPSAPPRVGFRAHTTTTQQQFGTSSTCSCAQTCYQTK